MNEYLEKAIAEIDAIVAKLPADKVDTWDEINNIFLEILDN